jgi:hypothetical protein
MKKEIEVNGLKINFKQEKEEASETNLNLSAVNAVVITRSPLRLAQFTTAQRDQITAQNGDIIYNTTSNKFQGYENGAWVNLV